MLDYIFDDKYESYMSELKNKISAENYDALYLFLLNTNLDFKQKVKLLEIISDIYDDGKFAGHHAHCNLNARKK